MNDDFSGPPGMDARRADSDRDVARARGQEKQENEGDVPESEKLGRPCRPGDKFPWEASDSTDLKVVYRKQSAIKLWDIPGS